MKCNFHNRTAAEADHILRDDDGNKIVETIDQLALKFTNSPFDYKADEENFYYLKTVLAKKNAQFGSLNRLYAYIKRKINHFEQFSSDQVAKYLEQLRDLFRPKSELFRELMNAKYENTDKCNFHDSILSFSLIEPKIQKRHKFAFLYQYLRDDNTMTLQSTQLNILNQTHNQMPKKTAN